MIETFYLGTHEPTWLGRVDVPLFVSHRRLAARCPNLLPEARGHWALDSGGFTELSMYGEWRTKPTEYVAAVRRYDEEIGKLGWAAPQDWMCEPDIINGGGPRNYPGTHLSVAEHQTRTVENFRLLLDLWDDVEPPFMPVLQGWTRDDYHRCADLYAAAGIDLDDYPVVGIGSVCKRQATSQIGELVRSLSDYPLHGFGVKLEGLRRYAGYLNSADSMAWSFRGRHEPGCTTSHKSEANCLPFALRWRLDALAAIDHPDDADQLEFSFGSTS